MREAGTSLKSAWRAQITGAGLGSRLGSATRLASFPKSGDSLNAASQVWSNAPVIIGGHDTGPLIRSKNGFWLAIPTAAAGQSAKGQPHPPRRVRAPYGVTPAVHLSPKGTAPAGGRGAFEFEGSCSGAQDRARCRDCADFPACAAGQAAQTAGSGAGCGMNDVPGMIVAIWAAGNAWLASLSRQVVKRKAGRSPRL